MNAAKILLNGHALSITEVFEQGGGLEELTIWCHTCDHEGRETENVEYREFADIESRAIGLSTKSAMWRTAFLRAERHARVPV